MMQRCRRYLEVRLWIILVVLIVAFAGAYDLVTDTPSKKERVDLTQKLPGSTDHLKNATMAPGRVVELDTDQGKIEFVLFEKDCPKTTARIARLIEDGDYNNVKFTRVEDTGLIQTAVIRKNLKPVPAEIRAGLKHEIGAVGMARQESLDSATSSFYILTEPWHHLDYDYCIFGRIIGGIDAVRQIKLGDAIRAAKVRPFTDADRNRFEKALQIEAERKTE